MCNAMLVAKLLVVALPAATASSAAPIHRPSARPQLVRSALSLRGGAAVGGSPSPGGGGAQMVPPHASTAKDVLEQARRQRQQLRSRLKDSFASWSKGEEGLSSRAPAASAAPAAQPQQTSSTPPRRKRTARARGTTSHHVGHR